ncbi:uncharacterized protein TNCV_4712551 [Trichonephila clavipes]|nr:uncharacterized protein TNCV_4712551 [Trichonephila clavipes]
MSSDDTKRHPSKRFLIDGNRLNTVERSLSERLLSGASNIRTRGGSTACTVCEYVFERQNLKNAWNKVWPDLAGEKDFSDDHGEEITDFVQSILGFQECDAEGCGFQMLNDDEVVIFPC